MTKKAADRLRAAPPVSATPANVAKPLPPDCPVRPLGMVAGDVPTAVYLSGAGTVVKLTGQQHGNGNLSGLFAPHNRYLWDTWPRISRSGATDGFRAELVREDLFHAAGLKGIFADIERIRGAGAWRGANGELVLHLGDRVLRGHQIQRWGELDGYVYPAAPAMLGPAAMADDGAAGAEVQRLFATWRWRHQDIAPLLLLGWCCAAMVGGALAWRPQAWITGDRGTGKSTLLDVIRSLLGPNGSVATANTTAAGIRQTLADKALPVLLDELEAQDEAGDVVHRVIELLRQSSSGALGLRGGTDHRATTFQIRSSMMAASILVPPLRSQDRSRIALLELMARDIGAAPLEIRAEALQALGQRLLRRMVDQWDTLAQRFATWQAQLATHLRLDARGCDQYGTLLAAAEIALGDALMDADEMAGVTDALRALLTEAQADDVADWRRCIDHLMTFAAEAWRGGDRMTIGRLVAQAAGKMGDADAEQAQRSLASYGLRFHLEAQESWVAVANQHQGLASAYRGSIWSGRSGTSGGWRQTLLRAPGAVARGVPLRFEGHSSRVVLVPVKVMLAEA